MVKGKKFRKLTALATTAAMSVMMMSSFASAATTYTPVSGTSCDFNKYLIMDAGDTVPNATFSFTVAPGTARSTDTSSNTEMQVLAGVGTPTIADVTFAPSDTGSATSTTTGLIDVTRDANERVDTLDASTGVELEDGEVFVTKQATVSFSGITFDEPGIYRYIITETDSAAHEAAGIMHDNDVDRVLDVYVTDDGTGTLVVSGYVLHTDEDDVAIGTSMGSADVAAAGDALDDKTDGFTNEYNSKDLKISKEVVGNQASRDKYFDFTVTATNVADDDEYVVSIANDNNDATNDGNADATSGTNSATIAANAGQTNPTSVTGAELKAGVHFYLQHGQSVVIRGLAPNAGYTVTENAEDYSAAVKSGCTNSGTIGTVAGNNKVAEAGFTNTRTGVIPTGIILSVAGLLIVGIIAVIGFVFFGIRSKKRYDED